MDNIGSSHGQEGYSTSKPPLFDGTNYDYWKNQMMIFLQAIDYNMWEINKEGPTINNCQNQRVSKAKMKNERATSMQNPKMLSYVSWLQKSSRKSQNALPKRCGKNSNSPLREQNKWDKLFNTHT